MSRWHEKALARAKQQAEQKALAKNLYNGFPLLGEDGAAKLAEKITRTKQEQVVRPPANAEQIQTKINHTLTNPKAIFQHINDLWTQRTSYTQFKAKVSDYFHEHFLPTLQNKKLYHQTLDRALEQYRDYKESHLVERFLRLLYRQTIGRLFKSNSDRETFKAVIKLAMEKEHGKTK